MRNVVLARIDDRLIHGEVITGWIPSYKVNRLYIVDDEVAADPFARRVLAATAPKYLHCFIYTTDVAAEKLLAQGGPKERLMILVKSPLTILHLLEKGVPFSEINLGGVGPERDRLPFFKNVSLDREEVLACDALTKRGCRIFFQLVPDQRRYEITDAIKQAKDAFGL